MRLLDVLRSECVVPEQSMADKDAALRKIAHAACQSPVLCGATEEQVVAGLRAREALGSTGFGNGIAIPHCRLHGVPEFVVGLLSVAEGVDFDAVDRKKVRLIVFIIGPERGTNEHIALLSEISHALRIPGVMEELLAARTPQALRESFLRHSHDTVDPKDHTGKNLFHVFIRDEDVFRDLLQVFAAMEPAALSIVEAKNASEYLSRLPLFAGFWSDRETGVCRMLTARVEKRFTNEIIRRIEQRVGKLDECSETVVAVQDVFFAAGNLRT